MGEQRSYDKKESILKTLVQKNTDAYPNYHRHYTIGWYRTSARNINRDTYNKRGGKSQLVTRRLITYSYLLWGYFIHVHQSLKLRPIQLHLLQNFFPLQRKYLEIPQII